MTETLVSTVVEQVPRHRFIPDRIWDGTEPVDRTQTPDR